MSDDIVTRLRGADAGFRIAVGTNDAFRFPTLHTEAADEIERLRAELQHSALQTNVMRNIATAPFGGSAEQIADLGAELAEFQRQYLLLKAELKQWQALCDTYYHKLALEPDNTFYFISGYRYLASGGK